MTELTELHSSQEETDTRVILYLHHAVKKGYKSAVVRTPDTDLFFILLHHANSVRLTIIIDIGTGKHRQLVNITELSETLGPEFSSTLLGYYVYSGEDCTSSFKGKGKVHALKVIERNPKYHSAFRQLGETWTLDSNTAAQLESFTCHIYNYPRDNYVNKVRSKMIKSMVGENEVISHKSKVDLSRIPPCQDSLIPHLQRVNYRVAGYRRAGEPFWDAPEPSTQDQGWENGQNGLLEPVWSKGPILPPSLADLLEERPEKDGGDEEEEDDIEIDFDMLMDDE